jgi:hypothetical protein
MEMATRTAAKESLELLLARTQPRESAFTRKRRTVERKPTELDDFVLDTYNTETPMEIEVPKWAEAGTLRTLRKSARFLEDTTGEEMRLKIQTAPARGRDRVKVKFMAHPPLERGRRVSKR